MKSFAVVIFTVGDTVGVIPENWVITVEDSIAQGNSHCQYPPPNVDPVRAAFKKIPPKKDWSIYSIRIITWKGKLYVVYNIYKLMSEL